MSRRSQDWNEHLAKDLLDPEFASAFIVALLEEGFTLQQALAKTIRTYGIKEFAEKSSIPSSNISRAIKEGHNPSQRVLESLLAPFSLKLGAFPVCLTTAKTKTHRENNNHGEAA